LARLPLNVVTTQLGRLKEARFVVVEGEGKGRPATYRVSDPMFHTWYQMRYLRPAGRRIELFVEFIRAWFSVEDRRQFLDEQWRVLGDDGGRGLRGYASQEASLAIRYYAFTLDDERERQEHIGRLADASVEAGEWREAAMLLAEAVEPTSRTERQCESAGYRLLGDRMLKKGKHSDAITAFREALRSGPGNVDAILGLGECLGLAGEHAQAASEFQRVIELPSAPTEQVARALFNRGFAKVCLGDGQGAIADYTAVVNLEGAPAEYVACALGSRGAAKRFLGDSQGAIADYTAVADLPAAPAEGVALALICRGTAFEAASDHNKALSDFQSVIDMPGVSSEHRGLAMLGSGVALTKLHRPTEAVARFEECLELRASSESVHPVFRWLIESCLQRGRAEEAARLIAGLHEFEPADTPIEKRLEVRIGAIANAGKEHTPETAALLLDAALKNDPEDVRVRMEFLAPAIEYARTGDEQTLARLPERERDMAKQIAAVMMGQKDRVEIGH
jgi:tetratricopeptide (TPR) repeat protein